jgi:predicted MFS family arabinose efflux permease
MVGSNLVSATAQGAIALLLLTHQAQLWHLIALQVIRGVALSFFFPASQGLVPQTVGVGLLQQANALLGMTKNGTNILGAALGGAFVAVAGAGWALAFDAGTYAASAAVLAAMRLPRSQKVDAPNMLRELREGWSEFASRTWLWVIVVAFSFSNMVWTGAVAVLGPIVAKRYLGGAAAWGVIVAAEGAGLLAGGLLLLRFRPQRPLFVGMAAFSFASLPLVLLASVRSTLVIALGFVIAGIAIEIFSVAWATAMQQHVPLDKLSRVSAYDGLGSIVFIPLGLAIAGPVADAIGLKEALWLAAAISTTSALATLAVRDVRDLRRRGDDAVPLPVANGRA